MKKVLLHVGCANRYYDGFINSDKMTEWRGTVYKLDLVMNMGEPWPYEDESVDGVIGMHVFQQLSWRELLVAFSEIKRILKPRGVLRMGCPMVEMMDKPLEWLLGWNNINLFDFYILQNILVGRMGFYSIDQCKYKETAMPEFRRVDNRSTRGTWYIEAIK